MKACQHFLALQAVLLQPGTRTVATAAQLTHLQQAACHAFCQLCCQPLPVLHKDISRSPPEQRQTADTPAAGRRTCVPQ